jgi:hypothetical protein
MLAIGYWLLAAGCWLLAFGIEGWDKNTINRKSNYPTFAKNI